MIDIPLPGRRLCVGLLCSYPAATQGNSDTSAPEATEISCTIKGELCCCLVHGAQPAAIHALLPCMLPNPPGIVVL